jgi:Holliday junction resolvase RusA-like endonuclease
VIRFSITCVPPSVTAQQKRMQFQNGRPKFFHDARMEREAATWAFLLAPYVPPAPLAGPLELTIVMVYPHLKTTAKRDVLKVLPKTSKPDCGNAAKHLEDLLAKMRFMADDAQVARLVLEKWRGPDRQVGIRIRLRSLLQPIPSLRGA